MSVKKGKPDDASVIAALAELSPIEYDRKRKEAAKVLECSVTALDKELEWLRKERQEAQEKQEEDSIIVDDGEYMGPVDGAELLDAIRGYFKAYVVAEPDEYTATALWVMGTYCFIAFTLYPLLNIVSPMRRCGKSIVIDLVDCLAFRALVSSNITTSAIFRIIEEYHPTLAIDEADSFMDENEGMRGVINSTHRKRTAFVIRSEKMGEMFRPKRFNTWTPIAIAGINKRAATITDRSVMMRLKRKLVADKVEHLDGDTFKDDVKLLRQKCAKWAKDSLYEIKRSKPKIPDCHNDRLMDNWKPLFKIAHVVGGDWPGLAMTSYIAHANADGKDIGNTLAARLLQDIDELLVKDPDMEWITSELLVAKLRAIEDGPWQTAHKGHPLDQNFLAFLLEPFGVKPQQKKQKDGHNRRSYECSQLRAECDRYLNFEEVKNPPDSEFNT